MNDAMSDALKERTERGEIIKAFDVSIDNDINTFGENIIVLALDITEAQVIAHEAVSALNEMTKRTDLRVKGVNEQCFVVAPELGFKVETWIERLKIALEDD
jgi:hypothetical protein